MSWIELSARGSLVALLALAGLLCIFARCAQHTEKAG